MISVKREKKEPVVRITGSYAYKNTEEDKRKINLEMMVSKIERLIEKKKLDETQSLLKTIKLANKDKLIDEKTINKLEKLIKSIECDKEERCCNFENYNVEVRNVGTELDNELEISGYVNKFGTLSQPLRKGTTVFKEKIERGAFKRAIEKATISGKPIKLLFRHQNNQILASTKNGSLVLEEDDIGFKFKANLIDTSLGKDVYKYVKSGLISNMSFGFSNAKDSWSFENGIKIRTLYDFDLSEISILDNPAYMSSIVE